MTSCVQKPYEMIVDYVTGLDVPNVGAEENRQAAERSLVEEKGYAKEDIVVDTPVSFEVDGKTYSSALDLVVSVSGQPFMVVKCAAGSLGSREREILAGARIGLEKSVPLAAVSDGKDWTVLLTDTGKVLGRGLAAVPSKKDAKALLDQASPRVLDNKAIRRERLIFRTYDMDTCNRIT